jgi:hypothetical protein
MNKSKCTKCPICGIKEELAETHNETFIWKDNPAEFQRKNTGGENILRAVHTEMLRQKSPVCIRSRKGASGDGVTMESLV